MNTFTSTGLVHLTSTEVPERNGKHAGVHESNGHTNGHLPPAVPPVIPDQETLRRIAWEIGERKGLDRFAPTDTHVALGMVHPTHGFAHWRIQHEQVEALRAQRGGAWHQCRMIVRLYDVTFIDFNGMNAHRVQDHTIHALSGHLFFHLPSAGTSQLAEVGFLLRSGEFIPLVRSHGVHFAPDAVSPRGGHGALLVNDRLRVEEEVGNLWEQEKILQERRKPKLRESLRIAALAFESLPGGQRGILANFVSELAGGQAAQGHELHVFVPANEQLPSDRQVGAVHYHPLALNRNGSPLDQALDFARVAEKRLKEFPPFDLFHLCEWMTGLAPWIGTRPTILSLSSIEATRCDGQPTNLSQEIQQAERELAHAVDCILTPDWLREQAIGEFAIDGARVHSFPMEARLPNEWDCHLDLGEVKKSIGLGPLDRLVLYVGPLEYDAGVDLLIDALPTALRRTGNLRLAYIGLGSMHGPLLHRAHELGVGHAVRMLGHLERSALARLLRSAEALILPSRRRIHHDEAVVDLARRAGRPVITTHSGPSYMVHHEQTGVITYDNPGSMVWALDRILSDPAHAEFMGHKGRRTQNVTISWEEAARIFLELCATSFPELRKMD